jgi:predicted nuclease of predicted toxin-antitoxin system
VSAFYADEQFPLRTTEHLRALGHDVQTVQEAGNANQQISDDDVLTFATQQGRAVLTLNRRDFIRLHRKRSDHAGIVVSKDDVNKIELAERIHRVVEAEVPLLRKLVRVTKSS